MDPRGGVRGIRQPYGPRFFEDTEYVADSRQKRRTRAPIGGECPDREPLLVHPELWTSGDPPMADIVSELVEERRERIDRYVDVYSGSRRKPTTSVVG